MKKLTRISRYSLAAVLLVLLFGFPAFAAGGNTAPDTLSGMQVVVGFAILLLVMLLPLVKSGQKTTAK